MEKGIHFSTVAASWLDDKENYVRKSTFATYSLLLWKHIVPCLGERTVIREEDIQAMVNAKLSDGLSDKTVKDMLVVLKMVLRYGEKHGILPPCKMDIRFPTPRSRHSIDVMTLSNQRLLLGYLRENVSCLNIGIYICLAGGLRIGEVCALQWADIDTRSGVIRISKTLQRIYFASGLLGADTHAELVMGPPKTPTSIREIPMTRDLLALIRPLKKESRPEHYVLSNGPAPVEPRTYRSYFGRLEKLLGLPRMRFHGLRHSFATRCIESRCDYKTVSVLLGHSNISTTLNLYVHPDMDQKRHCINTMDRLLK